MPMIIQTVHSFLKPYPSEGSQIEEALRCPLCRCILRYRDSRARIMKLEGGIQRNITVRRFQCTGCGRIHTEIPYFLLPYKHYAAEVVSGVLDEIIRPEDQDSEDYPSLATMKRWMKWFLRNLKRIESILQRMLLCQGLFGRSRIYSLHRIIRKKTPDWLERMIRIIYNNGESLPSDP